MIIRTRMITITLTIVPHYCLTKKSDLTFIGCHNVQIQSCLMVVMTSVFTPSWHEDVRVCVLNRFVPYLLHKLRLTLLFSYLWIWNIYVLTLCHVLSEDYVRVRLVNLFPFSLYLHAVDTFFCTIFLCLHVVSCPVSFCLHAGFDSFSSCLHVGIDFFLV